MAKKKEVKARVGRPLMYGEETVALGSVKVPKSKYKEVKQWLTDKLKGWEV